MPRQTALPSYEQLVASISSETLFYQVPKEMALKAINARLSSSEWALWTYLQLLDPHGDRLMQLPSVFELAKAVGISDRQAHRALNRLKDLELYYWEPVIIRGQNLAGKRVKEICRDKGRKSSDEDKLTKLSFDGQSCPDDDKVVQMRTKLSFDGQSCLSDSPKSLPSKDSENPQTSSDFKQTFSNPPDRSGGGGKNAYSEPERNQSKSASLASKPKESTRQVKASSEDKSSAAPCNDLSQMLDFLGITEKANSLLADMERLQIKPCQGYSAERIAAVIKECHLSQLQGALRHIEETWETINNPTAIFCSKAPKMPIEVECRLPDFDRTAYDAQMAQATTPEESKAHIERIKSERIKAIASSSGDKRLRKFGDLIPSIPSLNSKPNINFDTDYAEQQRRLARQMMLDDGGDAAT